jgi:hypothetical protein
VEIKAITPTVSLFEYHSGGKMNFSILVNATFNKAIVRYVGAPIEDPTTPEANVTMLTESQIHVSVSVFPLFLWSLLIVLASD